ncbi:glycosyltransferase family 4 protein [Noviherbaspirillum sp. ST9]|uniref:glycosyltransferase family 4 protein n=1 Tax=Noviherbaspirillum sp. ST9 TaxID=3401606 RepID=UPI003B58AFBC
MNPKIVISSNTAWNIHNFRAGLVRALVGHGYEVIAVAPDDEYSERVRALGCRFVGLPMDNHGTHPGRDLALLMRYVQLLRSERPCVYLGYTVKPNVYGSMAAHLLRIPVINNIAGLGAAFVENSLLTRIVKGLYKCGLYWSDRVFFQNSDDQELFLKTGLARPGRTDRLPGSGIDLARYNPQPQRSGANAFTFLLVARMLWYKGIGEYAQAARAVRERFPNARFQLLGFVDEHNPNGVSRAEIESWQRDGLIDYLGNTDDVASYLAGADCVVLPSFYREGVPRTLLEAAAMAKPIITTDTIGCRDVVSHGLNGLLCKVRDSDDLAEKMMQMVDMTTETREAMGWAGRRKMESEFDEDIVIRKYLDVIREILTVDVRMGKRTAAVLAGRDK